MHYFYRYCNLFKIVSQLWQQGVYFPMGNFNLTHEIEKIIKLQENLQDFLHNESHEVQNDEFLILLSDFDILSLGEEILKCCEQGVNKNIVLLLTKRPKLLEQAFEVPSTFTKRRTHILNHIVENKNLELIQALIDAGLSPYMKEFLNSTEYSVLYKNTPNRVFSEEKIPNKELKKLMNGTVYWRSCFPIAFYQSIN